jgi:hypothetical protein
VALLDGDVVLIGEDTSLVRAGGAQTPRDAGPLRSARDRGYVLHGAVAIDPTTGWPVAWLGAEIWTRRGQLRLQDHKQRAPGRKESRKWARRRHKVVHLLRTRLDTPRRVIHLTDREGDCWASLWDAHRRGDLVITRVAQRHRAIAEAPGGVQRYVASGPVAAADTVPVRQWQLGDLIERDARLELRWAPVTVIPPRKARGRRRQAVSLTAIWIVERDAPPEGTPIDVLLFTTVPVASAAAAWQVACWYLCRWGIEIAFDLLKNGCALEGPTVSNVASFKRLTALAGPTAVQVASWVAAARLPRPPPVQTYFDAATLRALRTVCTFEHLPAPPRWSVRRVVQTLARLGGWEPRTRAPHPGWRVVLRGWRRFQELRAFAEFLAAQDPHPTAQAPPVPSPRRRPPS